MNGKGVASRGRGRRRWGSPCAPPSAGPQDSAGGRERKLAGTSLEEEVSTRVAALGRKAETAPAPASVGPRAGDVPSQVSHRRFFRTCDSSSGFSSGTFARFTAFRPQRPSAGAGWKPVQILRGWFLRGLVARDPEGLCGT